MSAWLRGRGLTDPVPAALGPTTVWPAAPSRDARGADPLGSCPPREVGPQGKWGWHGAGSPRAQPTPQPPQPHHPPRLPRPGGSATQGVLPSRSTPGTGRGQKGRRGVGATPPPCGAVTPRRRHVCASFARGAHRARPLGCAGKATRRPDDSAPPIGPGAGNRLGRARRPFSTPPPPTKPVFSLSLPRKALVDKAAPAVVGGCARGPFHAHSPVFVSCTSLRLRRLATLSSTSRRPRRCCRLVPPLTRDGTPSGRAPRRLGSFARGGRGGGSKAVVGGPIVGRGVSLSGCARPVHRPVARRATNREPRRAAGGMDGLDGWPAAAPSPLLHTPTAWSPPSTARAVVEPCQVSGRGACRDGCKRRGCAGAGGGRRGGGGQPTAPARPGRRAPPAAGARGGRQT